MLEFHTTVIYISGYLGLFVMAFYLLSLNNYNKKKQLYNYDQNKTVSIIIPAWNEEKSIEKTIKSALALEYPKDKLEIIVVDDGSTDNTARLARKFVSYSHPRVRVFSKKNGGKGSALNFGIARSKSDIVISMDADTFVDPDAVKLMVSRFYDKRVMSVTPSMGIHKPNSVWQKIQQVEYYLGTFLRKVFATINSIHVTPGAFSAYRREFFLKHGGYAENILTEDMEVALRIQTHGYIIENVPEAVIHTLGPKTFRSFIIKENVGMLGRLGTYLITSICLDIRREFLEQLFYQWH
jgi:cellulose synthase/poly-beta-1,6-N-acetylglucosamine synthase-like glycosyltransferase